MCAHLLPGWFQCSFSASVTLDYVHPGLFESILFHSKPYPSGTSAINVRGLFSLCKCTISKRILSCLLPCLSPTACRPLSGSSAHPAARPHTVGSGQTPRGGMMNSLQVKLKQKTCLLQTVSAVCLFCVPLHTHTHTQLDVAIDGADEVDADLTLIKGGG